MKPHFLGAAVAAVVAICVLHPAWAVDGEPYIHDPSTVIQCDGKFYAFGTGGGGLISDDGWTWHSGAVRPGGGLAPDVIKIGDRYLVAYASKGGGMSVGHAAGAIKTMWTKTLDPKSADFGFHDNSVVASTDGVEDCVPSIHRSYSTPLMAGSGLLMGLTSATYGWSNSIPRRENASPATSR